jgi:hypothetical protein
MGSMKSLLSELKKTVPFTHMNKSRPSLLILALPMILFAMATPSNVAAQDRIIVQPRSIVVLRTGKEVRDFPERKKAVVRYPIVRGLSDAAVLRRIQNTLTMKNVFDHTLDEFRRNPGLLSYDHKVNYNQNYLLDITFTEEFEGAYPDTGTKHFLINLKNGKVVRAADAFNPNSLNALAGLVDEKLKAEVTELNKVNDEDRSAAAEAKSHVRDELKKLLIGVQNLNKFSVSDKGVTFLFDAGFPHAIQALQPEGEYFFGYAELRPYIRRDGPLGVFK